MKFLRSHWKGLLGALTILNVSVLATLNTVLAEAKSALLETICQNMTVTPWMLEVTLFLVINIGCIHIWFVVQKWRDSRAQSEDAVMKIAIDDAARSRRIGDYQHLREVAEKDILIMGIGMSAVSEDDSITELVQQGKNVRFLIMDPDVLIKPAEADLNELSERFGEAGILIDNRKFSDFYGKSDYQKIIATSLQNLKKFVDDQDDRYAGCENVDTWSEGMIVIKKYSFYVPMNVTICDMDTINSKLVAEFCLPFSTRRIRTKLSEGEIKSLIETQVGQLWKRASLVYHSGWIKNTSNL